MMKLTPDQEARYALDFGVARNDAASAHNTRLTAGRCLAGGRGGHAEHPDLRRTGE